VEIHGNKGTEAAIAAIKMAYIRQQASLSHQVDNQLTCLLEHSSWMRLGL
jgi:hypothetical protein